MLGMIAYERVTAAENALQRLMPLLLHILSRSDVCERCNMHVALLLIQGMRRTVTRIGTALEVSISVPCGRHAMMSVHDADDRHR